MALVWTVDHPAAVNMPSGQGNWRLRLNAAAGHWADADDSLPEVLDSESTLILPSLSCVVYEKTSLSTQ